MEWLCRYVECTSAAIQALTLFKKLYPGHRREEIENCVAKAAEFIENKQASDGSWFAFTLLLYFIFCILLECLFSCSCQWLISLPL